MLSPGLAGTVRAARPRHRLDGRVRRMDRGLGAALIAWLRPGGFNPWLGAAGGAAAAVAVADRVLTFASSASTRARTVGHRYSRSTNARPDLPSAARSRGCARRNDSASVNSRLDRWYNPPLARRDLSPQHLAERVHHCRHAVIPRFQQHDAEALVRRGHDQRERVTEERVAKFVRHVAERDGSAGDSGMRILAGPASTSDSPRSRAA